MDLWSQSILLGVVQGLTEFLPVSSSGHLVLLQHFLGFKGDNLLFDLLVHGATLLAVVVYFWRDLWSLARSLVDKEAKKERRLLLYIVVATVVTAGMGFTFKGTLEGLFYNPKVVVGTLVATGFILFVADRFSYGDKSMFGFGWGPSALVGLAQGVAIVPGISRSGSTVSAALLLGMDREQAGRFSFLIAIPAILGAFVLEVRGVKDLSAAHFVPYLGGMVAAFLVGLASIKVFLQAISRKRLVWFAFYCWGVAFLSFILFLGGY
ncbi:MAG TPA: undecaprenyl-diphosphate phosphatase [Thermosulfidibacter takaii]|uniref:Undecaprenyl-diphosphatase n=1 Tax=Thermosulfidibacter takaii TaxID=412593 RepID=A0A7C0Y8M3_9BACT|nr:undecaprenyl-diphosphate phosphatase [Thermosulfidibacter takaii]